MQRHFSSRGEALAEVTAARVLARRKAHLASPFADRAGGRFTSERWFSHPAESIRLPKRVPKRKEDDTTLL